MSWIHTLKATLRRDAFLQWQKSFLISRFLAVYEILLVELLGFYQYIYSVWTGKHSSTEAYFITYILKKKNKWFRKLLNCPETYMYMVRFISFCVRCEIRKWTLKGKKQEQNDYIWPDSETLHTQNRNLVIGFYSLNTWLYGAILS